MIKRISIQNFKSYKSAELKLAPLTVLIGANASGKSNALEAIRFLNWLAQGQKLSSLQYLINDNNRVVRGQISDLPRRGTKKFSIGCTLSDVDSFDTLEMGIGLRHNGELHIDEEMVYSPNQTGHNILYQITSPSEGIGIQVAVEYNNFAKGGKKPQIFCVDQMGIFLQLGSAARFAEGHTKSQRLIPEVTKLFEEQLAGILFLDPVPQKMRDYSFLTETRLQGDGSNLSAVLYHLWQEGEENEDNRRFLVDFIRSLPEQDIIDIEFLRGPRGEVMIQLKETFGGGSRFCDAGLLSDGTLRVLALAAALLSAKPGSMVIIEEVDNGVHPGRASKLLRSINEIARKRKLSILISSHNPALLDALPDEAVPDVVFCYRNPGNGWSELARLEDIPDYPELVAQGALGELLTKGVIERFVKLHPGAQVKKEQSLKWLEKMKN